MLLWLQLTPEIYCFTIVADCFSLAIADKRNETVAKSVELNNMKFFRRSRFSAISSPSLLLQIPLRLLPTVSDCLGETLGK